MAQSTLTINSVPYNIYIKTYTEDNNIIINEKETILDPDDYDAGNSILIANGVLKHMFSITGFCNYATRLIFLNALKNNTKVYPIIYPNNGTTNIITTSAYYYFINLSGNFELGNENYWYNMSLKYGGV